MCACGIGIWRRVADPYVAWGLATGFSDVCNFKLDPTDGFSNSPVHGNNTARLCTITDCQVFFRKTILHVKSLFRRLQKACAPSAVGMSQTPGFTALGVVKYHIWSLMHMSELWPLRQRESWVHP